MKQRRIIFFIIFNFSGPIENIHIHFLNRSNGKRNSRCNVFYRRFGNIELKKRRYIF